MTSAIFDFWMMKCPADAPASVRAAAIEVAKQKELEAVFGVGFKRDRSGRPIEQGIGGGGNETERKSHSHPVPSIVYSLTDCVIRIHMPDGKTRDVTDKAGGQAVSITQSHTAENIGPGDCQLVFVERK